MYLRVTTSSSERRRIWNGRYVSGYRLRERSASTATWGLLLLLRLFLLDTLTPVAKISLNLQYGPTGRTRLLTEIPLEEY